MLVEDVPAAEPLAAAARSGERLEADGAIIPHPGLAALGAMGACDLAKIYLKMQKYNEHAEAQ